MAYSKEFVAELYEGLEAAATEYAQTRTELDASRVLVATRYEVLGVLHKYCQQQGIDVPPMPPPPELYRPGVAKLRKLAKQASENKRCSVQA